jgi:RNA polymerase sigma factor (sigma-70 family)
MLVTDADLLSLRPQICRMGGRDYGEDLFQNVCVAVFKQPNNSHPAPAALIWRIAQQNLIDHRRREKLRHYESLPDDQGAPNEFALNSDPFEELERAENQRRVQQALSRLKPDLREALDAYSRGESAADAASQQGIPIGTFLSRLKKAKKMIKLLVEERREISK